MPRVIAIDWSGAVSGSAQRIWLAEVDVNSQTVVRLESGRARDAVASEVISSAARDPNVAVGLDFAFSLPAWYLKTRELAEAPALWELARTEGEQWLAECQDPFWGRPGRTRPELPEHYRRTDREVPSIGGIRPKSVFQIGGAGAVGTGSIRGMPLLATLREAGFSVWPFDDARAPLVVEIYPRALTRAVNKGDETSRWEYLARFPDLDDDTRERASLSDDAFDALVSGLVMAQRWAELIGLPSARDRIERLEGRIWLPSTPLSPGRSVERGTKNSSQTRVSPVFSKLFERGKDEPQWVKRLLSLASSESEHVWDRQDLSVTDSSWPERERGLQPPVSLLSWLIRNFTLPDKRVLDDSDTSENRRRLARRDHGTIEKALTLLRRNPDGERWHILEGPTYPDAFIETKDAIIVIEGKRTENGMTTDTTWMAGRHQMIRHLDAAFEIAGDRSVYGMLMVEGDQHDSTKVPEHWNVALREMLVSIGLDKSLPHRGWAERDRIAASFVGVTTWEAVRREFELPMSVLIDRLEKTDLAKHF